MTERQRASGQMRQAIMLGAILVAGSIGANVAARADNVALPERRICFLAKAWHGLSTGHAFVQLFPANNEQVGRPDLLYGHYPVNNSPFDPSGTIKHDLGTDWDYAICYRIDDVNRYNAVVDRINTARNFPDNWHLFGPNCVSFVAQLAGLAGVTLPAYKGPFGSPLIDDPTALAKSLQNLQLSGTTPANSFILTNKSRDAGTSAHHCSTRGIVETGFAWSEEAAARMRMRFRREALGLMTVGKNGQMQLTFDGATTADSVLAVDWGDLSPRTENASSASHTFGTEGAHTIRALVANRGEIGVWHIPVEINSTSTNASVVVPVPPPPAPYTRVVPIEPGPTPLHDGPIKPPPTTLPPGTTSLTSSSATSQTTQTTSTSSSATTGTTVPSASSWALGSLGAVFVVMGSRILGKRRAASQQPIMKGETG